MADDNIIHGIHVDVPGTEMQTIYEGRVKYHTDKANALQKQVEEFQKIDAVLAAEAEAIGKVSNSSPAASLQQALKKHRDLTIYFTFLKNHVVPTKTYRLDQNELYNLGIAPERHY